MPLAIHNIFARQEALAQLVADARPQVVREGEFVTAEGVAVAFLRSNALQFHSPTTIEWRPGDNQAKPPWLLAPLKPPFPKYHLLIKQPPGFFYAGDAHLGSFANDGSTATFSLYKPLPRDIWVRFGGYPHWLVDLNHEAHRLSPDDGEALDALLRRVRTLPHGHLTVTRYEEDSLHLFTNARRGWLMYLREPADSGLYVAGLVDEDDENEQFRCDCGIALEFPRSRTLPAHQAADVVAEFFRLGKLPDSVSWEPG